ncbi:MAG: hypothetical protein E6J75_11625 [Deltaproteobacteria bacterium]|nr:MAG: hypothetical protein E6J75_11625 [Deltaproteobacteria bacterium]
MSRSRRPRAVHPPATYLEFERPLAAVDAEIAAVARHRAKRKTAARFRVLRAIRRRLSGARSSGISTRSCTIRRARS